MGMIERGESLAIMPEYAAAKPKKEQEAKGGGFEAFFSIAPAFGKELSPAEHNMCKTYAEKVIKEMSAENSWVAHTLEKDPGAKNGVVEAIARELPSIVRAYQEHSLKNSPDAMIGLILADQALKFQRQELEKYQDRTGGVAREVKKESSVEAGGSAEQIVAMVENENPEVAAILAAGNTQGSTTININRREAAIHLVDGVLKGPAGKSMKPEDLKDVVVKYAKRLSDKGARFGTRDTTRRISF